MKGTKNLNFTLDPHGVRFLEKRLQAGEITSHVFKDILKHQMVKQYFKDYTHPFDHLMQKMKSFIQFLFKTPQNPSPSMEEFESPVELRETIMKARHKHF